MLPEAISAWSFASAMWGTSNKLIDGAHFVLACNARGPIGAAISALLHLLVAGAALQFARPPPEAREAEAPSTVLHVTTWLIDSPFHESMDYRARPAPSDDPPDHAEVAPPLPDIPAIAVSPFELAAEVVSPSDVAEAQQLQGAYSRQLRARVERIFAEEWSGRARWQACVARVVQDETGRILDVDLAECPIDDEQRVRVAQLVRASSPLPHPPFGLAMGRYVTLDLSNL